MLRTAFAILLILAASAGRGQGASHLAGRVEGNLYYAANGAYRIEIPVLPELGGIITDTRDVVTFEDAYSTHVTIAAFPQDPTQRWQLSTRGPKDYLLYFFTDFVLKDFRNAFKDVKVESTGRYMPGVLDGAFIAYILLPGGSMFTSRLQVVDPNWKPPVAKRGNLLFVKHGFIFVISTEMAERVTEGRAYDKTSDEEDAILRDRLVELAGKIQVLAK
jgi:hypothetical protein